MLDTRNTHTICTQKPKTYAGQTSNLMHKLQITSNKHILYKIIINFKNKKMLINFIQCTIFTVPTNRFAFFLKWSWSQTVGTEHQSNKLIWRWCIREYKGWEFGRTFGDGGVCGYGWEHNYEVVGGWKCGRHFVEMVVYGDVWKCAWEHVDLRDVDVV